MSDNTPVPEVSAHIIFNDQFGHNALCRSSMDWYSKSISEILLGIAGGVNFIPTCLHIFQLFYQAFIKEVFIPHINNNMVEGLQFLIRGELLVQIGLKFMMSTIQYFWRRHFWINVIIDPFETAPYRFNCIIPWNRFKEIIKVIFITD